MRALNATVLVFVLTLAVTTADAAEPKPAGSSTGATPSVTLITGDRVLVNDRSAPAVRPAPGRAGIPVSTFREDGHLFVIPTDAARQVAAGRLDKRLFDVTQLVEFGYHDSLPVIVTNAPAALTANAVTRHLPSINGFAMRAERGALWNAVGTASQANVWLDGKNRASLDRSVRQIGAPEAWAAGYTGTGVTIAVLDTGVDQTHPDLAGQEIAERNFSEAPDSVDRVGHGTHVASTAAGAGTRYRGVAPGAKILDAKVLGDDGSGFDSSIIAGLEWAAEQGAKVANLSIGAPDRPGIDPVEEAVNTLSAKHGMLVVAASGNDGRPGRISSPSSADAALAVGAVDRENNLAFFSSRGPRPGDAAIKPDITAPGVGIVAAQSTQGTIGDPVEPGYVALSGTSMATPHIAGSAALIAQQHPDWTGAQVKAALTTSAKPGQRLTPFEQGSGRVDVARAITQTVIAEPTNLGLGTVAWPHEDDQPVSRPLTYRNLGATDVILTLAVETASPAGLFALSANTLTVPAGGRAQVTLTGNTRTPAADGVHFGAIVATAGGTAVRTPVTIDREVESYDLTINPMGRDAFIALIGLDHLFSELMMRSDSVTMRLPKGRYLLESVITTAGHHNFLLYPGLSLTSNLTIDLDPALAKPVKITTPDPSAEPLGVDIGVEVRRPGARPFYFTLLFDNPDDVSVAHLGPRLPADQATAWVSSHWSARDEAAYYGLAWFIRGGAPTGFTRVVRPGDVATVHAEFGSVTPDSTGLRLTSPAPVGGFDPVYGGDITTRPGVEVSLPGQRIEYYNTDGTQWASDLWQLSPDGFGTEASLASPHRVYRAGHTYRESFNHAVFGPSSLEVTRTGDFLDVRLPLFGDRAGNAGDSVADSGNTVLYRDGQQIGDLPFPGGGFFEVPAEPGNYRVSTEAVRPGIFDVSTRVSGAWTFHSSGPARIPLAAIRFLPRLDASNSAPAGTAYPVPIQLELDGVAMRPRQLTVEVSYDEGRTWRKAEVIANLAVLLRHPAGATSVSLRAKASDRDGNTVEQTIIRAYKLATSQETRAAR